MRQRKRKTFAGEVRRLLGEMELTSGKLDRDYGISRNIFWKISQEEDYRPSFRTAVCFCFVLQCNFNEAVYLLNLAGYAFNFEREEDRIYGILFLSGWSCVQTVDERLEEAGIRPLFQ